MSCTTFNSNKRHLNALQDPEVREMLAGLKENWNNLPEWERGEVLINLVLCGCSARGLARELGCSPATILHAMDLADLMCCISVARQEAIMRGADPEPDLESWDPDLRADCHYERTPHFIASLAEEQAKVNH